MPSLVDRAMGAYRRKGVTGVVKAARDAADGAAVSDERRNVRTADHAGVGHPTKHGSLLDIGCNLGVISAHFAERGTWSVV